MKTDSKPLRDSGQPPPRVAVGVLDHEPPKPRMLPVWFFIGVILIIYGCMIFAEGLYELAHPPLTVLAGAHAPIWWGAVMAVVGVVFFEKNRHPGRRPAGSGR